MCGRYATTRSSADLSKLFAAFDETDDVLAPDYNLAPTDPAPIVRVAEGQRRISVARWGLLPSWADSPRAGARMINARSETLQTARAYARPFAEKRCLVPADGWFEWVDKKPFFMTLPEGVVFAGLWADNRHGLSSTIVTMPAAGELTKVHHRMPLLLEEDRWEEWLTAEAGPELLLPVDSSYISRIEIRAVGQAIGNVRNDGPDLVAPILVKNQETLF
ncbi:SOS response-associated peptidase [Catelliglobosispora koreensis]|uniref:SOS response-associated peptidase n=1 Tax=Catelliglobosispora koreensis TaxID=129052 RepID=UPI00037CDFB0|nr:SOS response-associated peptidase [Catelliglobosispora koreensis]